ncbi:hypothetical protein Q6348_00115 [Isoptericola sp. b441]|uniref:Zinc transporter n=1 Tax=Actinotalea lenta TaxID=3064654 RepID=A0ABT9D4J2_9CELL|nr:MULTISPECIES: hypothetical protein [unclassified Isoptericola]MDO8105599.1 hypothetical protein [Isoptericola sp. b441]MDO8122719.1 hypothetical protein [Isoptericola sp. b490]
MGTTVLVVLVVSGALLLGAAWGLFWPLPRVVEGLLVAMAGGALIVSVTVELVEPARLRSGLLVAVVGVLAGALAFVLLDRLVKRRWGTDSGGGLLAAITLDGVPENLALGVALIAAGPAEVAALAGSIFLSNLPEAAGGARDMRSSGRGRRQAFGLWAATAGLLSAAALAGRIGLEDVGSTPLSAIRCFAAGAVVASLATEVFPKAYREDATWAGAATAAGLVLAVALSAIG